MLKAITEAASMGDPGELAMQTAWLSATPTARIFMAAALGDRRHPGPADDLLREAVDSFGPGTQDLRCASLTALARRLGPAVTPTAVAALSQVNGAVKEYAIIALAAAGDGRGWDAALAWFSKYRPGRAAEPPSIPALSYLIRTLPEQPPGSEAALMKTIRKKWPALVEDDTAALVQDAWPDVAPGGTDHPTDPLTCEIGGVNWATHVLFSSNVTDLYTDL